MFFFTFRYSEYSQRTGWSSSYVLPYPLLSLTSVFFFLQILWIFPADRPEQSLSFQRKHPPPQFSYPHNNITLGSLCIFSSSFKRTKKNLYIIFLFSDSFYNISSSSFRVIFWSYDYFLPISSCVSFLLNCLTMNSPFLLIFRILFLFQHHIFCL